MEQKIGRILSDFGL